MHPTAVELQFQDRAALLRNWGIAVLFCAVLTWSYATWQLFTPYEPARAPADCANRTDDCASGRDWSKPMVALGISVPLSVTGTALLTAGSLTLRLRRHEDELQQAQE